MRTISRRAASASLVLCFFAIAACTGGGGGGAPTAGLDPGVSLSGDWSVTRTIEATSENGCDPLGTIGPGSILFLHSGDAVEVTSGTSVYRGTLLGLGVSFIRTVPSLAPDEVDEFDVTFSKEGTSFSGTYRRVRTDCTESGATAGSKEAPPTPPECCETTPPETFTVNFTRMRAAPREPGQEEWPIPNVWSFHEPSTTPTDSIEIPNGRPIYALIVSGYANNGYFDQLMAYNFARHLMAQGAYVHYAWWNNLLAPYMERPLHYRHSYPGDVYTDGPGVHYKFGSLFPNGNGKGGAVHKAIPGEDYQFVQDAKALLEAIREHNPSAMIILVGHSMGGGSIVHLARETSVAIDILAPIDQTNNRNFPFGGDPVDTIFPAAHPTNYVNWTRWRGTREIFRGFADKTLLCEAYGPWLYDRKDAAWPPFCEDAYSDTSAPTLTLGSHVINLYHRWQREHFFPFDYLQNHRFLHHPPLGGNSDQDPVDEIKSSGSDEERGQAWPRFGSGSEQCCPNGSGVGWSEDGHGEIVGWRGPLLLDGTSPVPLGVRVQTSPECPSQGTCSSRNWPARKSDYNGNTGLYLWDLDDPDDFRSSDRVDELKRLEALPSGTVWEHEPTNPNLCLVSGSLKPPAGLIGLFERMNKPPTAIAGENQAVASNGAEAEVLLDGLRSTDPENKPLTYRWTWATGSAEGEVAIITLPIGQHCITLTVTEETGHIDKDEVCVTVTRAPW